VQRAAGLFIHHLLAACGLRAWSNRPALVRHEQFVGLNQLVRQQSVKAIFEMNGSGLTGCRVSHSPRGAAPPK